MLENDPSGESTSTQSAASCPDCGTPYGVRRRCYQCHGRKKTGGTRPCGQCGKEFHVPQWKLNDTARNQGAFCSRKCMGDSRKGNVMPWARPDEKTFHSAGYILIWMPNHPRSHNGRILEHIAVMESVLGRPLVQGEFVHHKDGDKRNNNPDNLQVVSNPEHGAIHAMTNPQSQPDRVDVACRECGTIVQAKRFRTTTTDPKSRTRYCSRQCQLVAANRAAANARRGSGVKAKSLGDTPIA